jgi:hypothetical protein
MLNQDSGAKQFSTRGYRVLKYSSRSSISSGSNFSLNAGIVPLPFAITCGTASSECPEPSRRTPYKDGPTLVSPERMLWQTEHDFRKMAGPLSLDACVEALLANNGEVTTTNQVKKAMERYTRAARCFMRIPVESQQERLDRSAVCEFAFPWRRTQH